MLPFASQLRHVFQKWMCSTASPWTDCCKVVEVSFLFAAFNYISHPSRYDRIEIPIHVVPHETIGKVCLESAVELPKILCQEEQDAYRRIHR